MAKDMFLKIATVDGESTDSKHQKWIEILSYSHSVSQLSSGAPSTGGARSAERTDHGDFTITKVLDQTTPVLLLGCSQGTHYSDMTLELLRATGTAAGGTKYMEYKMSDVLVTNVSTGHSGEGLPIETVSFAYGKVQWSYFLTDHKTGAVSAGPTKYWSLVENKGG